jgi:hypothetical protein
MSLAMEFRPSLEGIEATRRFVSDVAVEHLRDGDWTSRVGLVAQELLENVLKYSIDGAAALTIDVVPEDDDALISVRVCSRGQGDHLTALRRLVREIAEAADPMAYYVAVMRKTARETDGSGLGLARIRAEAEMSLSAKIEGDRVCVSAQARAAGLGKAVRERARA